MKTIIQFFVILICTSIYCFSQTDSIQKITEERNKQLARNFYEDLWFNNRTDNYSKYMAEEYVAHDIGDRKDLVEPAIEQKYIADRFWNDGEMSGRIDYQIADGDLVATRWLWSMEGNSMMGKLYETKNLPIINVFRFNDDGKIVEVWNHRHDIDTNQTLRFTIKGLLIGLLIALIPTIIAFRYKRRLKKLSQ
ncbi:ester cyclase [Winogradskyella sp. A3E31]|uniref:ester cyclase n=1 Tax=Winogradskyella sp. A3E31 TaxID=3349637 RepID=UPI00398B12CE